jgi:hypothetical protein
MANLHRRMDREKNAGAPVHNEGGEMIDMYARLPYSSPAESGKGATGRSTSHAPCRRNFTPSASSVVFRERRSPLRRESNGPDGLPHASLPCEERWPQSGFYRKLIAGALSACETEGVQNNAPLRSVFHRESVIRKIIFDSSRTGQVTARPAMGGAMTPQGRSSLKYHGLIH